MLVYYGWIDQDETWHGGRPRLWPHYVSWGPSSAPPEVHSPQFLDHVCSGQMAGWLKMPLGREAGISPGDVVLDGDPAPLPKTGHSTLHFSAHVCCGQMARWIKMPLGTKLGLGPGHSMLDGDPTPPKKGTGPLIFGPCLFWPNGRPSYQQSQLLLSTCSYRTIVVCIEPGL